MASADPTDFELIDVRREFACEVLFEQNIDGKSVATLILDALLQVGNDLHFFSNDGMLVSWQASLDLRRQLADNILVIGGTAMMPGFLHRLNAELNYLVNIPTYVNKLAIREFHFHSPPAQLNYAAWLGGEFCFARSRTSHVCLLHRCNDRCSRHTGISVHSPREIPREWHRSRLVYG